MPLPKVTTIGQAYACLFMAILFEVVGTTTMKANAGFSSYFYSLLMFFAYTTSFSLMTMALEILDLGVTYAMWSGIGTSAVAIIGAVYYHEKMPPIKIFAIACVIASVVFLQFLSHSEIVASQQQQQQQGNNATVKEVQPLI